MQNFNSKCKNDLKKRAYLFALDIIKLTGGLDKKDYAIQAITRQLLRSATSIGANIIEAQAASSRKDFANFLNHSLKSANETKFWLGLLRDSEKTTSEIISKPLKETIELANILAASLITIRSKK